MNQVKKILRRVQSFEQFQFDENIFKAKAAVEVSEIVRSLPNSEDMYELNKYF
jgi:hypothetical protein